MSIKPIEFESFPRELRALSTYGPYQAVITSVVDGDTLVLMVSQGFQTYTVQSIRLKDINAPEINTTDPHEKERGLAAKAHLQQLCPPSTPCLLITHKDKQSFNRYVGRIILTGMRDVCEEMVNSGHAEWVNKG